MAKGTPQEELRKKAYLVNKTLYEREYKPNYPDEYELCVFCWSHIGSRFWEHYEGYFEEESQSWICHKCAEEFSKAFRWELVSRPKKTLADYLSEQEDFEIPLL